ncbi:Protein DPCD [Carpediemonas membranifera]|uniref:Protein DPCD n=1 Tax=Carpediemonas membranifera TaxID=201153 RepID=A0A8J6AY80_9EUKA|nr:Protein DPCD [Carpediemonas membranifera]|eukprot:KAG9390169.1 Protein DPCD [Carpediemonas membranifera]
MSTIPGGKKTAIVKDGRRKIHSTFDDGTELVEEFDIRSNELVIRKWKKQSVLTTCEADWEYEVGEAPTVTNPLARGPIMRESSSMPKVVRLDQPDYFYWEVRNMRHEHSVYSVSAEDNMIVIRTSNKKYFKRIPLPDMERMKLSLNGNELAASWDSAKGTTYRIRYRKPPQVLAIEAAARKQREAASQGREQREGDVECPQQ